MNRLFTKLLMTTVFVIPVHCASAQDSGSSAGGNLQGDPPQGEIVVTALRREATIQTVPVSIAALTGENLAQMGATGLPDYFRTIPNLNLTQGTSGQSRITVRGVNAAGDATTGLYYDETPIVGPSGTTSDSGRTSADLNLFDVERVEVLRGPQGTLYGASSMAGTVRVLFNKPDLHEMQVSAEGQLTSTKGGAEGYFAKAMVNLPVLEDLIAVRLTGYYEKRPGYIDNIRFGAKNVDDSVAKGIRALVRVQPTPDTNVTGTIIYQKSSADNQPGWYPALGDYKTNAVAKLPFDSKLQLYNVVVDQKFSGVTLTGTASYYRFDILRTVDFTAPVNALSQSPAACRGYFGLSTACTANELAAFRAVGLAATPAVLYQPADVKSRNFELRLASSDKGPLQWTIGGYYEKRDDHIDSRVRTADAATGSLLARPDVSYRYVASTTRQLAGFGELSYSPSTDLTLTAGLRYYDYKRTVSGQTIVGSALTGTVAGPYSEASASANGVLQKYTIDYRFTPTIMGYVTASQGFRPGGANNIPGLPAALVAYKEDSLWNYEAGLKTSWLDNALVVNAALFQMDWKDMQVTARTADGLFLFLTNAGRARVRGGELEVTARPFDGLTLTSAAGYVDARLTEDQANSTVTVTGSTGRAGNRIPDNPNWTASASAAYSWAVSGALTGSVRADYAFTGKMGSSFRPDTDPFFVRYGGYSTVNARIGVEADRWGAAVFVQNAGNVVGLASAVSGLGFTGLSYSIPPRTVGLNVHTRF